MSVWSIDEFREYTKAAQSKKSAKPKSVRKSKLSSVDAAFSLFMRATESNYQGLVKCCTCGKWMNWKGTGEAHWGHWQSRGFNSTRFNEKNGGVQCRNCNTYLEGRKSDMERYLVERYGRGEVDNILAISRLSVSLSNEQLSKMAAEFRAKAREVIKRKGI